MRATAALEARAAGAQAGAAASSSAAASAAAAASAEAEDEEDGFRVAGATDFLDASEVASRLVGRAGGGGAQ